MIDLFPGRQTVNLSPFRFNYTEQATGDGGRYETELMRNGRKDRAGDEKMIEREESVALALVFLHSAAT